MTTAQTAPAEKRGQAWRARRMPRLCRRVAREISLVAPVDHDGRRRGSDRHHGEGCFLGGILYAPDLPERTAV